MKIRDKSYFKNTAGLSFAGFGHCIFISLTSMALPMFFTDIMFISPTSVSAIFLVTRIWDAINDPMIGTLVDRSNTRWGKCRPFLLYGAIPLLVSTVLMFLPVSITSESGKVAYAMVTYLLFITAFTVIDIPLAGMKPLLFTDPEKRNKASSFSSTLGSLGSLLAIDLFFAMVVIFGNGNDKVGYLITVIILAVIAFTALLAGFFTTKEVVPISKKRTPFKETVKIVLQNKSLLNLIVIQLCSIGISAYGILLPYFSKWNLADSFSFGRFSVESVLIPILSTATGIIYMVAMMITPYLLKHVSKKKMFIIMSVLGAGLNILSFTLGYDNLILFIGLRILAHVPPTITGTIISYMIMDCLDIAEYKHKTRTEGSTYAINNLVMKTGNAVFSAMVMFILGMVGYNAAISEPALKMGESIAHNFPEMLEGIFISMTIMPAIGLALQILPMLFYKLDDKKVKQIVQELEVRRKEMAIADGGDSVLSIGGLDSGESEDYAVENAVCNVDVADSAEEDV